MNPSTRSTAGGSAAEREGRVHAVSRRAAGEPPSAAPASHFLDRKQAAAYLGTTERHIRYLVEVRRIPVTRVGRKIRHDVRLLDKWVAQNTELAEP